MIFFQILTLFLSICASRALNTTWWKHITMYEVFLKSFKDSDGDGIGDLPGVTSKLDYFVDIGVDTVWVTPFYPTTGADAGYDITDFYGIDPLYGTMADFEEFMRELKNRGLNFVMDLVINHSSDEHEWFQKSIQKIDPYTDYYLWIDPKGYTEEGKPIPPNNWVSVFNKRHTSSGWTWNEQRKQFYFHQFHVKQPDFNLRNENIKKELKAIMQFWLNKGVSGFRIDAAAMLLEDPLLRDEDDSRKEDVIRRYHHPDTYTFLHELYLFLKQYDRENKRERETAMMTEAYATKKTIMKYYGTAEKPSSHFTFNFKITTLKKYLDARQMIDYLNEWETGLPVGAASNWVLGNHDQGRVFNRFNREYNSVLLTLVTMLPGAACIYYGEELSQELFDFEPNRYKDLLFERDHFRSPMHWDDSFNAGFTSADKPWAPVHPNYWFLNVQSQKLQPNSTLNYFKDLVSIRKTEAFKYGDLKLHPLSKWVLAFTRTYHQSTYVIVLNLGMENHLIDLHSVINNLPLNLKVAAATPNSGYTKGDGFNTALHRLSVSILRPHSGVVLTNE